MSERALSGRYVIVRELGRGRTGVVYLARDLALGRDVALREIPVGDPGTARRFVAALGRAAKLDQPSIVSVFDCFADGDSTYVVSEYLPHGSLRSWAGRLTLPQLVGVLAQLLDALAHAHARDVLHLDLRPESVFVTTDGRVKVADFGVAEASRVAREDGSGQAASNAGPPTDLHDLGVTAYELVVGWPPFDDIAPSVILMRYRIDPTLVAWVDRLLETKPEARPVSAHDALAELGRIRAEVLGLDEADEARLAPAEAWELLPRQPDIEPPAPTRAELRPRLREAAEAGVVPAVATAAPPRVALPRESWTKPPPAPTQAAPPAAATTRPRAPSSAPSSRRGPRLWPRLVAPLLVVGALAAAAKWLLGLFVEAAGAPASDADVVDCTVFAPPSAAPGGTFLVQVFVHLPEEADDARAIARELDVEAQRRAFRSLEAPVRVGSRLDFELRCGELHVDDPFTSLVWRRRTEAVQFAVAVPANMPTGTIIGTVSVSVDSVPLGHVKFKLAIEPNAVAPSQPQGEEARRYRFAFISYSSKDRDEVLRRVQLLPLVGIGYFQDVLSIEPGDRWSKRIAAGIDECDLFLLFWSSDAKQSEWVRREVRYALTRKGGNELQPPEIRPVVLEGPPIVKPWEELAHLHFNDRHLYFVRSQPSERACTVCGNRNDEGAQFCGRCGTYLGWQREPEP